VNLREKTKRQVRKGKFTNQISPKELAQIREIRVKKNQ